MTVLRVNVRISFPPKVVRLDGSGYLHLLGGSDGSQDGEDGGSGELHVDGFGFVRLV